MTDRNLALDRVLSAFVDAAVNEPVLIVDRGGRLVRLNRVARLERHRPLVVALEVGEAPVAAFLREAFERGRATLELPSKGGPGVPAVLELEAFAVEAWVVISAREERAQQRRLEDELTQLKRVEALSLLTASVIHDFNNLMTPMLALSTALAAELQASGSTVALAADIESIAGRMVELFHDMVALTRPGNRRPEVLNLAAAITELSPLIRRVLGDRIELKVVFEPATIHVSADRSRLEHALLNLVANARHAMPTGGLLEVSVITAGAGAATGEADAEPSAVIVVRDNGQGMPEEVRARALEDFFTTRTGSGGTGLGLSSVKRFVADSGGTIALASELGRGTTIEIRLPQARREPLARETGHGLARPRGRDAR
jgi:signal transduction histidine kinase